MRDEDEGDDEERKRKKERKREQDEIKLEKKGLTHGQRATRTICKRIIFVSVED